MRTPIGRTVLAGGSSGRGNHAASQVASDCLPKRGLNPQRQEEHDGRYACIIPTEDRVLIERLDEPSNILLTDQPKSIKGLVLAVGPGKWISGTWWCKH